MQFPPKPADAEFLFAETTWIQLFTAIGAAFRFDTLEYERFSDSKVARLIAAIPYLASCENPERTALSHLATLVLASRNATRKAFSHKPQDDANPLARLATIADFQGGDRRIIDKGLALLGIVLVSGYLHDAKRDIQSGKYNPVASLAWNPESLLAGLAVQAGLEVSPEMDGLLGSSEASKLWWEV